MKYLNLIFVKDEEKNKKYQSKIFYYLVLFEKIIFEKMKKNLKNQIQFLEL